MQRILLMIGKVLININIIWLGKKIELLFKKLGINESDIIYLKSKGLYRIKKHFDNDNLKFDSKYFVFGDV